MKHRLLIAIFVLFGLTRNALAWECGDMGSVNGVQFENCITNSWGDGKLGVRYTNNNNYRIEFGVDYCDVKFNDGSTERAGGWEETVMRPGKQGLYFISFPEAKKRSYTMQCFGIKVKNLDEKADADKSETRTNSSGNDPSKYSPPRSGSSKSGSGSTGDKPRQQNTYSPSPANNFGRSIVDMSRGLANSLHDIGNRDNQSDDENDATTDYDATVATPAKRTVVTPSPSRFAPGFKVVSTSGQQISLDNYRGYVLILIFFASWDTVSRDSIPHLNEINRKYGPNGLQILGLTGADEEEKVVRNFARELKVSYPIALAGDNTFADYSIRSYPVMVIVDKKGRMVEVFRGFNSEIGRSAKLLVEKLLAEN